MTSLVEQDQLGNNLGKGEAPLPSFDLPSHPNIPELEYSTPQQRKTHLDRLYLMRQNRTGRPHFGFHKPSLGYISPIQMDSLEPIQMRSIPAHPEPLQPLGPVLGELDYALDSNEPAKPQAQLAQPTSSLPSASQAPPVVQATQAPITTAKATSAPITPSQATTQSTVKPTPAPTTVVPTTAEKPVPTQPPQIVPAQTTALLPIVTSKATSAPTTPVHVNTTEPSAKPTPLPTTAVPTPAEKPVPTQPPQTVPAQTTVQPSTTKPTQQATFATTASAVKITLAPEPAVPTTQATTVKPVPTQGALVTQQVQTTSAKPIKPVPEGSPPPSIFPPPIAHGHSAATTTVAPKALIPLVIVQVVQPSSPLVVPPSVVMKMTDHFLKGQFARAKKASNNQTVTLLSVSSSSIYPFSTEQESPPPLEQIPPIPTLVPTPVPTFPKTSNIVQPLVKITAIDDSGSTTAHFNITITNKALGAPQVKREPDILITIPKELMPTVNGIVVPKTINVTVFAEKPAEKKSNNPNLLIVETTTTPGPQPLSDLVKPVVKITAKEASGTSSGHFNITITNKLVNSTQLKSEPDVFITIPKDLAKNNAKTINVTVFADKITTYSFKQKPISKQNILARYIDPPFTIPLFFKKNNQDC